MVSRPQASRGDETRQKIIDAAEALMAERGVEAVSINEIVKAAGQRNPSALNYHFGNKAGVVQAVFDRHTPRIEQRRQQLLDALPASPSLHGLIEALVLPLAEQVDQPDGGQNYLKLIAKMQHLSVAPQAAKDQRDNQALQQLAQHIREHCVNLSTLDYDITMSLVRGLLLSSLADYCRRLEQHPEQDADYRPVFLNKLMAAIEAILVNN